MWRRPIVVHMFLHQPDQFDLATDQTKDFSLTRTVLIDFDSSAATPKCAIFVGWGILFINNVVAFQTFRFIDFF